METLIVDGYNVIFAWPELCALAQSDLSMARDSLALTLDNYCGFAGKHLVLVFDAHSSPADERRAMERHAKGGKHSQVVFTKRGQTADNYIERYVRQNEPPMTVATGDGLIQVLVFGQAARLSARELRECVREAREDMERTLVRGKRKKNLEDGLSKADYDRLDKLRK